MRTFSKTAAAAIVLGTMGLSAIAPVAYAQDQTQTQAPVAKPAPGDKAMQPRRDGNPRLHASRDQRRGGMMGPGILNLVCSPRGAERLEHVFVAVSHRAAITDAQKPAFDALKTAALTAQTEYADTCKASFDAIRADGKPDPIKALQARLAVDSARVEALTAMLPKIEDFYKTLTPEQKAALQPSRRQGMNNDHRQGNDRNGRHHQQRGVHPQTTDQLVPAPAVDGTKDVQG